METEENKNEANEPIPVYGSADSNKTIHFFSSFEEMNEFDLKEMANSTPLQRLQNITYIILNRYSSELQKPINDLTLHFGK